MLARLDDCKGGSELVVRMIVEHALQFFVGDLLGRGRDSEIEHACGLSLHEDESSEIPISCKQEVVACSGFLQEYTVWYPCQIKIRGGGDVVSLACQEFNRYCPHIVVCKDGHEAEGDT